MKKLLIKLLGLQSEINAAYVEGINKQAEHSAASEAASRKRKVELDYPIGKKFMLIGNSPGSTGRDVLVAKVFEYWTHNGRVEPLFEDDNGQKFFTFGKAISYDPIKLGMFNKMTWDERWNAVAHNCAAITKQQARNLEAGRPAWDNGDGTETN